MPASDEWCGESKMRNWEGDGMWGHFLGGGGTILNVAVRECLPETMTF